MPCKVKLSLRGMRRSVVYLADWSQQATMFPCTSRSLARATAPNTQPISTPLTLSPGMSPGHTASSQAPRITLDQGALRFSRRRRHRHRPPPGRMLMITVQQELEEQRHQEEAQREGRSMGISYSSGRGGRWTLGKYQARHEFEESGSEYEDVYEFDVELPM